MYNKLCFYHVADLDGKCSAAIVKMVKPDFELIPFDYNREFPWKKITSNTEVIMVDVSLPKDDMYKLNKICLQLIYIDHHISKLNELDLKQFEGLQIDGTSACELTWKYFLNEEKAPRGVILLSKYDTWDLNEDVLNYQYGIRALDLDPNDIDGWNNNVFNDLFIPLRKKEGMSIRQYIDSVDKNVMVHNSFKINFDGYNCLAVNKLGSNSIMFQHHPDHLNYDIFMAFGFSGKTWKVSLYTLKDDIDVSQICMKFGGGGHRKAAGFTIRQLPFLGEHGLYNN
jgi:oligoribonuclease NrnB/cAMP/cGMP phosphodiesterase (DHH superfamily)